MPQLRLYISTAVAVGALMLLTASPASADTPPPPGPASLPVLTVPGTDAGLDRLLVRFAVWLWSIGSLSYSASTIPDGNALGTWISVCCFAAGVLVDALLTTDDASPAGDDMALSPVSAGGEGFHGSSMAELASGRA